MPAAATKKRPNARPVKSSSGAPIQPNPARFDASQQQRRVLIAKIHVAKKEMGLLEDDYRAMLIETTGWESSSKCSVPELRKMVEAMKAKGFKPKKSASAAADHPFAKKARAMWISLYHLSAIENPSEAALEAFARRQLKVARMAWANQQQTYKLIEALKAIANRNGWDQRIVSTYGMRAVPADTALRILKVRLVERIAHLLGERKVVPVEMPLGQIAWTLAGMKRDVPVPMWSLGDLDLLAKALGEKLREAAHG